MGIHKKENARDIIDTYFKINNYSIENFKIKKLKNVKKLLTLIK